MQQGKGTNSNKEEASQKKQRDADQSTVVIATITGGLDVKEMSLGYRKAQIRRLGQVMTARELGPLSGPIMTFGLEDMRPLQGPHNDSLVVQLKIATAMVQRVLVDTGSYVAIITLECFEKRQYSEKDLEATGTPLVGFGGQPTYLVGMKRLSVRIGEKDNPRTVDMNFLVVDVPMAYYVIIGRPTLSMVKAVIAPYLLLMQFKLDDGRIGELFGDQRMACECYYVSLKTLKGREETTLAEPPRPCKSLRKEDSEAVMILSALTEEHERSRPEPTAEVEEVPLDNGPPRARGSHW